jgi:hypothetical protein
VRDWVVKLIDVYPDAVKDRPEMGGYELAIAQDIMRGRYQQGMGQVRRIDPERRHAVHRRFHQQSDTQEGPSDHGPGPEHLVPTLRPQPADLRREHLRKPKPRPTAPRPIAFIDRHAAFTRGDTGSRVPALRATRDACGTAGHPVSAG